VEDPIDGLIRGRSRGARLARSRGVARRRALVGLTLLLLLGSDALLGRPSHGEEDGWFLIV
jgi:hypothetical protein